MGLPRQSFESSFESKAFDDFWYVVRYRVIIPESAFVETVLAVVDCAYMSKLDVLMHWEVGFREIVVLLMFIFTPILAICLRVSDRGAYLK